MKKTKITLAIFLLTTLSITSNLVCQEAPIPQEVPTQTPEPVLHVHIASLEQHALHIVTDHWYRQTFRAPVAARLTENLVRSIQHRYKLKDQARQWGITPQTCIDHLNADALHHTLWQTRVGHNTLWQTRNGLEQQNAYTLQSLVEQAAREGNNDCLRSLLSHSTTPHTLIQPEMLFEAIEYNERETAHILLEQSAHYATTHRDLARHIALLNARSHIFLDTPLHASLRHRRFDLTNFILRYYPDMTSGDHLGKYPLQAAVYAHAPEEIIIRLLRQDATTTTVNHADDNGYTALHDAAKNADGATVNLLLANGAHLESCEHIFNRTPLYLAAIHGNYSTAQALLRAGANPTAHIENTSTIVNATLSALTLAKNAQREQNAQLPESQEERYQQSIEPLTTTALLFIHECDQLFTDPKIIQEIARDARACASPEITAALQARGIDILQCQDSSTQNN